MYKKIIVDKNAEMRYFTADKFKAMDILDFFARQFDIRRDLLNWGIMRENGKSSVCVLIDGTNNFIDVVNARFRSQISVRGTEIVARPARFYEVEPNHYQLAADFDGETALVNFTKQNIKDIYHDKVYHEGMEKEVFF